MYIHSDIVWRRTGILKEEVIYLCFLFVSIQIGDDVSHFLGGLWSCFKCGWEEMIRTDNMDGLEKKSNIASGTIPLDALFRDGDIPAKSYNVMKDDAYCGEIRIGLNFTAQRSRGFNPTDGNIGGWKQSGRN
ncbi:hypothetical protein L1987_41830 [Smallanthus sonchifolius]|uniref:Uncharacterized protein n=1 Tax=Smallanthus sonchifolius TaxID=185202 RepID=A0ACB9GUU7_9ASTR|nr:hypothetical protein L1987_41830 [Smallanthus sonchifolius]